MGLLEEHYNANKEAIDQRVFERQVQNATHELFVDVWENDAVIELQIASANNKIIDLQKKVDSLSQRVFILSIFSGLILVASVVAAIKTLITKHKKKSKAIQQNIIGDVTR